VPVIAHMVATNLGARVIGLAMGLIFAGHWVGAAIGSFLGGQIYAAMARYDWVWLIALGLAVLAGFLSLGVPEPRGGGRPVAQPA
jgi:predicted MFS family arabinose efflux permease